MFLNCFIWHTVWIATLEKVPCFCNFSLKWRKMLLKNAALKKSKNPFALYWGNCGTSSYAILKSQTVWAEWWVSVGWRSGQFHALFHHSNIKTTQSREEKFRKNDVITTWRYGESEVVDTAQRKIIYSYRCVTIVSDRSNDCMKRFELAIYLRLALITDHYVGLLKHV